MPPMLSACTPNIPNILLNAPNTVCPILANCSPIPLNALPTKENAALIPSTIP